jgi:hypothetical protein
MVNLLFDTAKLISPLENLRTTFFMDGATALYSDLELYISQRFAQLIEADADRVVPLNCTWAIFEVDPVVESEVSFVAVEQLRKSLLEEKYVEDFYFESSTHLLAGYMSCRDNFSVVICRNEILSPTSIEEWDVAFAAHLSEAGLGFGSPGSVYANQMVAQLPPERRIQFSLRRRTK